MAHLAHFAPIAVYDIDDNGRLVSNWHHVFKLLRSKPKHKAERDLLDCANGGRRRSLPFIEISPFGGTYFGRH